jgi:predicted AAA+ superfamily ATPase
MYTRSIGDLLLHLSQKYPVLTLLGPRQSGKTTLVRQLFSEKPYVNLESPDIRARAQADGRAFIESYRSTGAVFDEVQRVPELLSYVQVLVDEAPSRKGYFVLTGSHQLSLHAAISQSLAGRTTLQRLLPLSLAELEKDGLEAGSADQQIWRGGMPRIYVDHLDPTQFYRDYLQTYVERDVRSLANIRDLLLFEKFLGLLAGRIGQLINTSALAGEVGVAASTIQEWISILEASFIIFRLPPYFENFGKRLVKTPKVYFTDTGLACFLLGIQSPAELARDPLRGHLFENLVILEVLKAQYNQGHDADLYFLRDTHGHEVDALLKKGRNLLPIEIKSSQTFHPEFLKNVQYFRDLIGARCLNGALIYAGAPQASISGVTLLNYAQSGSLTRKE